jgi:hypothetical protein
LPYPGTGALPVFQTVAGQLQHVHVPVHPGILPSTVTDVTLPERDQTPITPCLSPKQMPTPRKQQLQRWRGPSQCGCRTPVLFLNFNPILVWQVPARTGQYIPCCSTCD